MKQLSLSLLILVSLNACNENENISNEFTGNESTYALIQGSDYLIQGTASLRKKPMAQP